MVSRQLPNPLQFIIYAVYMSSTPIKTCQGLATDSRIKKQTLKVWPSSSSSASSYTTLPCCLCSSQFFLLHTKLFLSELPFFLYLVHPHPSDLNSSTPSSGKTSRLPGQSQNPLLKKIFFYFPTINCHGILYLSLLALNEFVILLLFV